MLWTATQAEAPCFVKHAECRGKPWQGPAWQSGHFGIPVPCLDFPRSGGCRALKATGPSVNCHDGMGKGTSNFPASIEPYIRDISYHVWRTRLTGQSRAGRGGLGRGLRSTAEVGEVVEEEEESERQAECDRVREEAEWWQYWRGLLRASFTGALESSCSLNSCAAVPSRALKPAIASFYSRGTQKSVRLQPSGVYTEYIEEVNAPRRCRSPSPLRRGLGAEGSPAERQLALAVWYLFIGAGWVLKSLL